MTIEKAKEPKEFFPVEGATHVALYDKKEYVDPAVEKPKGYFKQYLQ